ncbi:hypothetical protein HANVADRAFT_53816 [Hanseniaspora valbyensis NRRL Y-1626]|uniref:1,3-beta-glucan synthase n=1 Tax=Hanseniaspora valbyensis NRRL Y-1626 TaxID=766949 RepID=A0A1B7TA25_9ASCO|nr:hypothetical protein HANVADRAFT_53816 [Hanseniaspora valbyensis NRRL Y-1626]
MKKHVGSAWIGNKFKTKTNRNHMNNIKPVESEDDEILSNYQENSVSFNEETHYESDDEPSIKEYETGDEILDDYTQESDEDEYGYNGMDSEDDELDFNDDLATQYFPHTGIHQPKSAYIKIPKKKKINPYEYDVISSVIDKSRPGNFTSQNFAINKKNKSGKKNKGKYTFKTPRAPVTAAGVAAQKNFEESTNDNIYTSSSESGSATSDIPKTSCEGVFDDNAFFQAFENNYDPYPMWCNKVPVTKSDIAKIFSELGNMFLFQDDNLSNIFDYLLRMLDSRASRMSPIKALRSLYLDYIGGEHANFRKWYFASKCDDDDYGANRKKSGSLSINKLEELWINNYQLLTTNDYIIQISLYLLIWGEAGQIRYMPECLCFIYKCCIDRYYYLKNNNVEEDIKCKPFLDHVITPLYNYYRDQQYDALNQNTFVPKDKDHINIIGYDDINQFFWFRKSLVKIPLIKNKKKLYGYSTYERYLYLNDCNWKKTFHKTYKESRTWYHVLTNFNRIWIIHICVFWYYTVFNSKPLFTPGYRQTLNNPPSTEWTLSIMSLSGSIAALINLLALIGEFFFCPRGFSGSTPLFKRIFLTMVLLVIVTVPTCYIIFANTSLQRPLGNANTGYLPHGGIVLFVYVSQFLISISMVVYYSFTPLNNLYFFSFKKNGRDYLANIFFTDSVVPLKGTSKLSSISLWIFIFFFKFLESYFFLTLSLKDALRELKVLNFNKCVGDALFGGKNLCKYQSKILLILVVLVDMVLFFLDTYLWYIIANTFFSVFRSFYIGVSIWTPWKNIFARLPSRIYMKVLHSDISDPLLKQKLVSEVWNSIIISMYREHLISFDHVQKLIYTKTETNNETVFKEPNFFMNQEDTFNQNFLFKTDPEAQRRVTFFAQSLSTPILSSYPINEMPSFTVLIPHYKEKIMLTLKEIIKNGDDSSQITLLEYLKSLHESEWKYFIQDTKQLVEENNLSTGTSFENDYSSEQNQFNPEIISKVKNTDKIPVTASLALVGFKTASPEYVLRTRIWASLRSQTLYRTISGFMNYSKAIKILYDVEDQAASKQKDLIVDYKNGEFNEFKKTINEEKILNERAERASITALRKFRLLVSMQRMTSFGSNEEESKEFLLRAYPELQISYIEDILNENTGLVEYYSCLIDGSCEILENGKRKPKYRIKLSGNPILGDGKADNQNHCVIFARGEYLQLIDANQDNYLEECLKIRNVLAEFEFDTANDEPTAFEDDSDKATIVTSSIYKTAFNENGISKENYESSISSSSTTTNNMSEAYNAFWESQKTPVAIIGTREYIFSENIGVLGDVAAGKEQTFGTLAARTLAEIGGKLHYGHPDFLNTVFVTTRGGVSKGQKGLHLNEDIYSGMNALIRGGRIKHCEYIQCGKGRDLGFGSILNFTTKIGAGMGEQFLSREYFYLGTQLPLDRFLSFYYAHPGFHLNNTLIIASIKLFVLVVLNLSFMISNTVLCSYNKNIPFTDSKTPTDCSNLIPVIKWLRRSILSIFSVFLVAFIPLFFQELMERGTWKAVSRISKHFVSFSPLFEVFVCKVYSTSVINDLTVGGARYIATGRGFATTRSSFSRLYSRFAPEAFYYSSITLLLLLSATFSAWEFSILYFWTTLMALMISPFLFNPNQFLWGEFFLDYKKYLRWLSAGNTIYKGNNLKNNKNYMKTKNEGSWINYIKDLRTSVVGSKKQNKQKSASGKYIGGLFCKSPSKFHVFFNKIVIKILFAIFIGSSYLFANSQNQIKGAEPSNAILRILLVSLAPLIINAAILIILGVLTITTAPLLSVMFSRYPSFIAIVAHILGVINHIVFFQVLLILQRWSIALSLLGLALSISIQNLLITIVSSFVLTKELTSTDRSNKAWWSGRWFSSELGKRAITQPFREFLCKLIEMSWFSADFLLGHFLLIIQIPVLFIPYVGKWHSLLLFWLKPSEQINGRVLSVHEKKRKKLQIHFYTIAFFIITSLLLISIFGPLIFVKITKFDTSEMVPTSFKFLIQPDSTNDTLNSKKGFKGYKILMAEVNVKKLGNRN